jgi:cytochrome c
MKKSVRGLLITSLLCCYPALGAENGGSLSEFKPTLTDEFRNSLRAAYVAAGEATFMRKCSSCHDHEKTGGHGKGPHLWNII